MTDTSNRRETVHIIRTRVQDCHGKDLDCYIERIMVPLNAYQVGNLIDAIAQVPVSGDWWGEFCDIVARAMEVGGIQHVSSNRGKTYSLEQIANRDIQA